ncbi:stage II sporulation protein R [Ureibacillus suwonensis]|uniref:Stage II sporulation protein R n=1 Tax=Ureibacillus suwonensis TaxID=313007 RepID=A0ABW0RFV2_9BACL
MLNDYEIIRKDNDRIHPIISILKLIASSLAVYCFLLMVPDLVDQFYEARENMIDDSLKIRVIANSNTKADQALKNEMVASLEPIFSEIQYNEMHQLDNDEAFAKLATYIVQHYSEVDVKINRGEHLIPPKWDGHAFYPQAYYDSLVLTIGAGRGDNFWCSIFSNLCERPSDQEKEEAEKEEEKEVRFLVWEWLKKWFA